MEKRKHYDLIIAWANGEQVQVCDIIGVHWMDIEHPYFSDEFRYRIKPKPLEYWTPVYFDGRVGSEYTSKAAAEAAVYDDRYSFMRVAHMREVE
jgi:hypothetical protein